jgi:diguanylate cyclase (GGDEF)-like protein
MSSATDPEALRRHLRQLTALHQASTRIVSALEPEKVLSETLAALDELVSYREAAIRLVDAEAPTDPPTDTDDASLVVPLVARGQTLGSLEIALDAPLDGDDLAVLELLAATAAVALQNAHLYQETQRLATTDPLTGLSNYRHFHEQLALEVQRARRMHYAMGLLIMDLDHFKQINDRHGHPAGDRALQRVAELLRKRLRRTDVVGRVGGEEFAVILPGDDLAQVGLVAEALRKAVEDLPAAEGGGFSSEPTPITLSIGGTSVMPETLDTQVLVDCADQALYEAKRNGRNQVRVCQPA